MEYIRVHLMYLDVQWKACTVYYFDDDGQVYYTILLNTKYNDETLCKAYDHEIAHIDRGDFDSMIPADQLEAFAHTA